MDQFNLQGPSSPKMQPQVPPLNQESPSGFPPLPSEVPGPQDPATEIVGPEQKQILLNLIAKIKENLANLKAVDFAGQNKVEALRRALLQQVFEKLQLAGVDLADREAVAAFIANLRAQNPLLAKQFEQAMNILIGNQDMGESEAYPGQEEEVLGADGQNMNMNNPNTNEAISQG